MHVRHELHEIRPQTVRRVLISRREKRDEAEIDAAGAGRRKNEACAGGGRGVSCGSEGERIFFPRPGERRGLGPGDGLRACVGDERGRDGTGKSVVAPRIESRGVFRGRLHRDAPVTVVGDAAGAAGKREAKIHRQRGIDGIELVRCRRAGADDRPVRWQGPNHRLHIRTG